MQRGGKGMGEQHETAEIIVGTGREEKVSKKSAVGKIVRKSAGEVPSASRADLDRLRAAMRSRVDTHEIPERRKFHRLRRDASGRLPLHKSMIREAVARQMKHLHL